MKLGYDQLFPHLERNLRPVYLITGDEILLVQEAADAVRAAAKGSGFTERVSFTVDTGFDWQAFKVQSQSGSLFSDKQCLELRIPSAKLNEAGKKTLAEYFENPPASKLLLIITGKLDAALQKSTWVKMAEQQGVVVQIWPLAPAQIAPFLLRRLQKAGFKADSEAVELLVARTQGNLLAAAQEIEKLSLLYAPGRLTLAQIDEASADNARFNVFDLADQILQGNAPAIVRILSGLREEGVEPTLILWALTRELRQLIPQAQAKAAGKSLEQVLAQVWEKRKPGVRRILGRHSAASLMRCLQSASRIDTLIKGAAVGTLWDELTDLSLAIAGIFI
ncbi:MAG TPA: DNA polymerase III subunit delta [Gammaproteobacteria bacterium]|nr:DNA polymerase III subunit delta [Gammaproteobacteria bacterium]